jgi:hypothetical protein
VYHVLGLRPPKWKAPRSVPAPATALLQAYAEYLTRRRGNPETTIEKKLNHVGKLQEHLAKDGKTWRSMKLVDIDAFLICAGRFARSTVSDIACTVRSFSRFLFASGHISVDLAEAVVAPVQPRYQRPRRALPWKDVRRLLQAIDTSTGDGRCDYAWCLRASASLPICLISTKTESESRLMLQSNSKCVEPVAKLHQRAELSGLRRDCEVSTTSRIGYKLHLDVADGDILIKKVEEVEAV